VLIALALLAVVEAVPTPTVELTLTGTLGSSPVSAAPRSLSDVARERREGRKGVGGFSAVETTVPRGLATILPAFDLDEEEQAPLQPDVVTQPQPPAYETAWMPGWYGGGRRRGGMRPHPAFHATAPKAGRRPAFRPSAPQPRAPRPTGAGSFRQRPG
jgi:hypothetical protein